MGDGRGANRVLVGRPDGKRPDLDIDFRIILKWILKKRVGVAWAGLIWLRIGTVGEVLRMRQ
jgi:hypothetical protein